MTAKSTAKLRLHARVSALVILIGLALVIMMIVVEGELGALPLGLIVFGSAWHMVTRRRIRTAAQQDGPPTANFE